METEFGVCQLVGETHNTCEDRYRVLGSGVPIVDRAGRGFVFAVMDGVGDTRLGMQAANEIASRLTGFYLKPDQYPPSPAGLKKLINEANDHIAGWKTPQQAAGMPAGASALTLLWINPIEENPQAFWLNAGDTAGLRLRDGELSLMSGSLTPRAGGHFVGMGPGMRLQEVLSDAASGDRYCLISDGVTRALGPETITAKLKEVPDPSRCAEQLVQLARNRGSTDDITALVVDLW